MDVAGYYDDYTTRQVRTGINDRHRSILRLLKRFGMQPGHRVLEIGCGIGTLTELIADEIGAEGALLATDLSPKSIEIAQERLGHLAHVELIAGDVITMDCKSVYDVVVLPDVIEHIPLDQHPALFARTSNWLKDDAFALLHYPNPHHLEWLHANQPEVLQIIDQPVHANVLTANAYANGLYLSDYERYSIWHHPADYIVAVLRPASGVGTFTHIPQRERSILRRAADKAKMIAGSFAAGENQWR